MENGISEVIQRGIDNFMQKLQIFQSFSKLGPQNEEDLAAAFLDMTEALLKLMLSLELSLQNVALQEASQAVEGSEFSWTSTARSDATVGSETSRLGLSWVKRERTGSFGAL